MHNTLTRISNVFSFFTTVVTVIACSIALLHLVSTPIPNLKDGALRLNNVQVVKGRPHYYSSAKAEFAHIKFDLDIDLSHLFTWNTKQIFLYITSTYPSTSLPNAPLSQTVIWDAILPHPLSPSHHNQYIYPTSKPAKSSSKSKKRSSSKSRDDDKERQKQVPGLLRLGGQRPKYQITDPSGRIAEKGNATLELNFNIQPWVGALTWFSAREVRDLSRGRRSKGGAVNLLGLEKYINTWNYIPSEGARARDFDFPALKERSEAVRDAGKEGLGTERGAEGNRLMG